MASVLLFLALWNGVTGLKGLKVTSLTEDLSHRLRAKPSIEAQFTITGTHADEFILGGGCGRIVDETGQNRMMYDCSTGRGNPTIESYLTRFDPALHIHIYGELEIDAIHPHRGHRFSQNDPKYKNLTDFIDQKKELFWAKPMAQKASDKYNEFVKAHENDSAVKLGDAMMQAAGPEALVMAEYAEETAIAAVVVAAAETVLDEPSHILSLGMDCPLCDDGCSVFIEKATETSGIIGKAIELIPLQPMRFPIPSLKPICGGNLTGVGDLIGKAGDMAESLGAGDMMGGMDMGSMMGDMPIPEGMIETVVGEVAGEMKDWVSENGIKVPLPLPLLDLPDFPELLKPTVDALAKLQGNAVRLTTRNFTLDISIEEETYLKIVGDLHTYIPLVAR